MYSRTTTLRGNPRALDQAIAVVRDEWLPATTDLEGCTGLSMLAGRRSGRCIVASGWRTEETMQASADSMRPHRARISQVLGAVPMVNEWEIAVMHRVHPAGPEACCRVTWGAHLVPDRLDDDLSTFRITLLPRFEELVGFTSASLMVDRVAGRTSLAVTYADREAMFANGQRADLLRDQYARAMGARVTEIAEFDLAVAHLRVPETV